MKFCERGTGLLSRSSTGRFSANPSMAITLLLFFVRASVDVGVPLFILSSVCPSFGTSGKAVQRNCGISCVSFMF